MRTDRDELTPYIGPRPFERNKQDRDRFFGRDRETNEIVSLIFGHPLVLVYAQSGAGKTSLFNARIAPVLEEKGFEVLPLARVGVAPTVGLEAKDVANLYLFHALLNLCPEADPQALADESLSAFLEERPRAKSRGRPAPRALVFDQFEEIFTVFAERWREQQELFFRQVDEALTADPLLRVVFVIREDYLARLDPFARLLPGRLRTRFRLERLHKEAALSAVTGPLRNTGRSFEPGVAETLVTNLLRIRVEDIAGEIVEVPGEFVEPVQLQVVCQNLWRELPSDVIQISERHLLDFGDVDRVLARFYEEAIKAAALQTGVHQNDLRQWCETWLITSTGTRGIVHRGPELTEGLPNEAVDILQGMHLIAPERRAGARWYALTHDRLIGPIRASNERWNKQREEKAEQALSTLRQAERHMVRDRYERALSYCQESLSISEEIGDWGGAAFALSLTGDIYSAQSQYEEALEAYGQALQIEQYLNDAQGVIAILTVIGSISQAMERYDAALEAHLQALQVEQQIGSAQDMAVTLLAAGGIYQQTEQYEEAVQCFTDYIALLPGDPLGYDCRAVAYWYWGRYPEAIADFTNELGLDSESFNAYNGRGQAFAEMGEYEQAAEDLDRALELGQEDAVGRAYARNGRALAYAGLGQYERALQEFEASIKASPDNAWVYYNRSLAYEWMGQYDRAIADLETALSKKNPRLNPLKRERAQTRLRELGGRDS